MIEYLRKNPERVFWTVEWERRSNGDMYLVREAEKSIDGVISLFTTLQLFDGDLRHLELMRVKDCVKDWVGKEDAESEEEEEDEEDNEKIE